MYAKRLIKMKRMNHLQVIVNIITNINKTNVIIKYNNKLENRWTIVVLHVVKSEIKKRKPNIY